MAQADCLYDPPFSKGKTYRVIQAFNGKYSHKSPLQYGVDFEMPIGTLIHASRSGKISKLKMDSSVGGSSPRYIDSSNLIVIDHGDGTNSLYAHLKKGSYRGQVVKKGLPIGRSACTGWCEGPHLHFEIF